MNIKTMFFIGIPAENRFRWNDYINNWEVTPLQYCLALPINLKGGKCRIYTHIPDLELAGHLQRVGRNVGGLLECPWPVSVRTRRTARSGVFGFYIVLGLTISNSFG